MQGSDPHDALGGSEFYGGDDCGCSGGGVLGGSPVDDHGLFGVLANMTGWPDMQNGLTLMMNEGPSKLDGATYVAVGFVKLCVLVLIILLVVGEDIESGWVIAFIVLLCVSAAAYLALEAYHQYGKYKVQTAVPPL